MDKIIAALVRRPLLGKLILVFIVLLAFAAAIQIKQFAYPRVDMLQITITTVYPGASPEDVELNVTVLIEEALEEIEGILSYHSQSLENQSLLDVRLDPDSDQIENTKDQIQRAMDSLELPDNARKPEVHEVKVDNFPIFEFGLTSDTADPLTLRQHALELQRHLLNLESVSRVDHEGLPDREIKVFADLQKMQRYQIAFDDIIESIKLNKLRLSGGSLESYTTRTTIVTMSEFYDPQELGQLVLRANDFGYQTILSDVAEIEEGFAEQSILVRYNGIPGIALDVKKKGNADVMYATRQIKEALSLYENENLPDDINLSVFYDASVETRARLNSVYYNALLGFFLVLAALFFFLDTRVAIWTAVGIPFAIMIALIAVPFLGLTINSISLLGIVVVLGMLVDDAIIISEAIYRERENGLAPLEASIAGLQKVIYPIITTIATTIIAFIPIFFLPGMAGDFSREVPAFVILMLIASLLESTVLLPTHLAETGKGKEDEVSLQRKKPGQKLLYHLENHYVRLLNLVFKYRLRTMIIASIILIIGLLAGSYFVRFQMFPADQATDLWIYGETDARSTLAFTEGQAQKMEEFLNELPSGTVSSFKLTTGRRFEPGSFMIAGENQFSMGIILSPPAQRDMTAKDVQNYLFRRIEEEKITSFSKLDYYIDGGGPPVGKPLEIRVSGHELETLQSLIDFVQSELHAFEITEIDSNYRAGKEEIVVKPLYPAIARARLSTRAIASTIRTAFDGTEATELRTANESIPVKVGLRQGILSEERPLENLHVRNPAGNLVPLTTLVSTERSAAAEAIFRYNGIRTYTITANIDLEKTTPEAVYESLKSYFTDFSVENPDYQISYGGEAAQDARTRREMITAIGIAIVAIYFLLVIQFNSFAQPFMVLAAIPFGMLGIFAAFILQSMDLSLLALIGILGFTGVVINDSLVMVHFMNQHRGEKEHSSEGFYESLIEGARKRLRPILLTTITTVVGLIPTAYGFIGGFDTFVSPMVMAMTWGLVTGTFSILFIVPVLYSWIEQGRNILSRKL